MNELCLEASYAAEKSCVKICIAFIGTFLFFQCLAAQTPDSTFSNPTKSILPLKLINFSGRLINDNEAVLNWQSTGGIDGNRFEISWSGDNRYWQMVGTVSAKDNDSVSTYSWKYSQPSLINFYRLKMIDVNGQFSYGNVIRINGSSRAVVIYPNPAKNNVFISSFSEKPATVIFLNSGGRILLRKTINEPVSSIDISNFTPGNYIIRIIRDNKATIYQLVKQ
jgi:hypothetical protein